MISSFASVKDKRLNSSFCYNFLDRKKSFSLSTSSSLSSGIPERSTVFFWQAGLDDLGWAAPNPTDWRVATYF